MVEIFSQSVDFQKAIVKSICKSARVSKQQNEKKKKKKLQLKVFMTCIFQKSQVLHIAYNSQAITELPKR